MTNKTTRIMYGHLFDTLDHNDIHKLLHVVVSDESMDNLGCDRFITLVSDPDTHAMCEDLVGYEVMLTLTDERAFLGEMDFCFSDKLDRTIISNIGFFPLALKYDGVEDFNNVM